MKGEAKPGYAMGALIAIAGLVVAYAVLRFVPEGWRDGAAGALSGAFGVLAASRLWPGLPFSRMHYVIGAIVAYGLMIGLVGRL